MEQELIEQNAETEKEQTVMALYIGEDYWRFGVPRCVPRTVTLSEYVRLSNMFPGDFTHVNLDRTMWVGSGVTVADFDPEIKDQLPADPRILVIRDMGAGDMLMLKPALRALRAKLPTATIHLATQPKFFELFGNTAYVDALVNVHEMDLTVGDYNLIINWARGVEDYTIERNRGHRVDSFAASIGLKLDNKAIDLHIPEACLDWAQVALPASDAFRVGIVAGAGGWNRSYPRSRWGMVIEEIRRQRPGAEIVFVSENETDAIDADGVLNFCGNVPSFLHAGALLARCDVVISPDSGLAHVCGILGVPTLVLMGSIPHEARFAYYRTMRVLHAEGRVTCSPCWDHTGVTLWKAPEPVKRCMRKLLNVCMNFPPDEVAIEALRAADKRYGVVTRAAPDVAGRKIERVSAVVTCHNNVELTIECIDALKRGSVKPNEIILIDNGSTDDTRAIFMCDPDVRYVRRPVNDGSIIGRNVGMKLASGDRIFVLDNDQIVSENTLAEYLKYDADIVGCELREANDDGVGVLVEEPTSGDRFYMGIGGLMVKRSALDRVGYLDEGFAPAYCDDPDFFWRAVARECSWAWCRYHMVDHRAHATLASTQTLFTDESYRASHERLRNKWPLKFPNHPHVYETPLVSYVIPTYNRAEFLPQCLDSILAQDYPNIEIIVVDDGSTDGTETLIREKYPTVRYLKNDENRRIPYTLNRGFRAARGEFVCWLSSDDGVFPEKTAEQVRYMQDHPAVDLSWTRYEVRWQGDSEYTGVAGNVTKWKPMVFDSQREEFLCCFDNELCNANGSTAMFRRSAFRQMGYFIDSLFTTQDWEMWLRYLRTGNAGLLDKNLGWRVEHAGVSQGICQKEPEALARFDEEKRFVKDYYRLFTVENRPTICAMLVVKDEEFEIERCLDDLILWVDKIVLYDDGSQDRTVEIARQYPKVVDIFEKPFIGNIRHEGKDREILLSMAMKTGCDWILFIDCDEVFEDRMKRQVYDMVCDPDINLWHFHEVNFWRSETHYRIDESYNKGWFGRLFRRYDGATMRIGVDEHCGGIPANIPGCSLFYGGDHEPARKAVPEVLHYGFSDYARTTGKAYRRWVRDPLHFDEHGNSHGGHVYYERMVNETGLQTVKHKWGAL